MTEAPACEIREIRESELDDALQLAHQLGSEAAGQRILRRLSLVAHDSQGQLLGAVLCLGGGHSSIVLEVVVSESASTDIARQMLDKALSKLRCEPVHRCEIRLPGESPAQHLWATARWDATTPCEPAA